MKWKIGFKFLLSAWLFSALITSCREIDLTGISNDVLLDESLVLPIGQGSATVKDILTQFVDQSNIVTDVDTINYVSNYQYEYKFKDFDLLANKQPIQITINGLPSGTILANTPIPTAIGTPSIDLGLDPNSISQRVDSAFVNSTSIGVTVSVSNINVASSPGLPVQPADLKVTLKFPTIYKQSDHTKYSVDITPYLFNQQYNLVLKDVIVDTHGQSGVPVQIILTSGSRSIKLDASSSIKVGLQFNAVNFKVAYGFFKPASAQTTAIAIPLDMLSSLPKGMQFANPKADINVQSNIGSWLDYNIDFVQAYNKSKTVIKNAHFVNGSLSTFEVINKLPPFVGGFSNYDLRTLDKNYGTTNQLFETNDQLDTLKYQFSVTADPSSPQPSYVVPGMKMTAKVKVRIPMYLEKGSLYNYTDTITYENKEISYVDQGILVLKVTNGLPVNAKFTMKLMDANYKVINSTLNDSVYVIKSASVGTNGLATSAVVTNLNINLTSAQLADIKNAKAVAYTILLSGQDALKEIQFTTKDLLMVKLGIFAKGGKTVSIGSTNN